jgi:Tfp pilus assembly protein PilV
MGRRGITLIEILLALIVMVLGVVGILALFPPALQQAAESMEDTQAAILGESVAHALVAAMRNADFDKATLRYKVTLTHDLYSADPSASGNGEKGRYEFILPEGEKSPAAVPAWYHYPGAAKPPPHDPGAKIDLTSWDAESDNRVFKLGGDGWMKATTDATKKNDPTDAWTQFGFSLNAQKVPTLDYLMGKPKPAPPGAPSQNYRPDEVDRMQKLYEFKIIIYRIARAGGTANMEGQEFRRPVAVLTKRISVP